MTSSVGDIDVADCVRTGSEEAAVCSVQEEPQSEEEKHGHQGQAQPANPKRAGVSPDCDRDNDADEQHGDSF
jgi:hypothetical protein